MTSADTKTTWRPLSLHRLVPIVMARRKAMLIGAGVGLLVGIAALAATSSKYQITSSVMLQLGREMGAPPTLGETPAMPAQKRPEDVATAVEIMNSQDLLEQVVNSFGEDFFYARPNPVTALQKARQFASDFLQGASDRASSVMAAVTGKRKLTRLQRVVIAAQQDLTIEAARRSDVVDITYVSSDPDKGKEFLTRFLDLYRQAHLRAYQSPKARDFFLTERDRLGKELADAEAAMARYKAEHNAFSGDDQLRFLLQQQQGMNTMYATIEADVARVTAQVASLKQALSDQPADLQLQAMKQRNALLDVLHGKLAEAEAEQARVHSKYADDSRMAQDADHEVQELHNQLAGAEKESFVTGSITTGINETRKALETELLNQESELEGLRAQSAMKKQQLDELNAQLRAVDAADAELVRQAREIELLTESYRLYSKHLEDARILDAMDRASISNVAVVEPPTASLAPVYPPAKLWLIGAVLLGAALPLGAGLASDALRPTVHSPADIQEALGAPTLARVPDIRHWNGTASLNGHPEAAAEFSRLCAELRSAHPAVRSIGVTALDAGDGTTRVASALARGLAREQHCRTLLIDTNFARPTVHKLFGFLLAGGLRDAGASPPVPRATDVPGLMVVTAGAAESATAAEVTAAEKSLLDRLGTEFDMVVLDVPAITPAGVASPAMPRDQLLQVDGVLLVVEPHATRLSQLTGARQMFSRAGIKVLGVVINRSDRFLPRALRPELEGAAQ